MTAPCGLDCIIRSQALIEENPCQGCNGPDGRKPEFCARSCGIILCRKRRENGCDACPDHPCADVMEKENRYTSEGDRPKDLVALSVEKRKTERALAESEGLRYLRLACPDRCWPTGEAIDAFIDFPEDLDKGARLHFRCQAGSGRTGAFMTIYGMMQKPNAPVEEILLHQAETG